MRSSGNSNHGSKYANGQKNRDFRRQLGLTQLELATKIDCSERLVGWGSNLQNKVCDFHGFAGIVPVQLCVIGHLIGMSI